MTGGHVSNAVYERQFRADTEIPQLTAQTGL
jgi:hypothetical protein